jgi:biotin operon repressor
MTKKRAVPLQVLTEALGDRKHFTVEALAKELGVGAAEVHRALLKLRVQPGWSIFASNSVAYGRRLVGPHTASNRWRRKPKTAADHDPHEPEWEPTVFQVRSRPPT